MSCFGESDSGRLSSIMPHGRACGASPGSADADAPSAGGDERERAVPEGIVRPMRVLVVLVMHVGVLMLRFRVHTSAAPNKG
jgi:hypothetical protein